MLRPISIPGLFITGTDTAVGKTLIGGAIASALHHQGMRVGVCKPIATGCPHRREGLVSEDAEFLAHHADSPFALDVICPVRYAPALAPAVAAERAGHPLDWTAVQRSLDTIAAASDIMVVEGVGGILVPLEGSHTVLDLAAWIGLPVLVVARAALGTINHTLLTLQVLRARGLQVAGVVINRYPAENPSVAEETSPRSIERLGRVPVLTLVPDDPGPLIPTLPPDISAAIHRVDWPALAAH